jgi:hypothetical protein
MPTTQQVIFINRLGNGLKFDGNNDYVSLPDHTSMNFQHDSVFTITGVIKQVPATIRQMILNRQRSQSGNLYYGYNFSITNTLFGWYLWNGNLLTNVSFNIPSGMPFGIIHFSLIKSGLNASGYYMRINDVLVPPSVITSDTLGTGSIDYGSPGFSNVGSRYTDQSGVREMYLASYLYHLGIVNRVITPQENNILWKNYNANFKNLLKNDRIADWNFNKKNGTLLEEPVNNINGTLVGFANTSLGALNAWVDENQQPITT